MRLRLLSFVVLVAATGAAHAEEPPPPGDTEVAMAGRYHQTR